MVWYCIKHIEIDSNIFKSNAHRSPQRQRQTRKDDVCRENSLKEDLSLQTKIWSVFVNLPSKVSIKPSRHFCLNQRPTPSLPLALILLHVKDQHEFLGAVGGTS